MRTAGVAVVVGALAVAIPLLHHMFSPAYEPVADVTDVPSGVTVPARRASHSSDVQRQVSVSAGGEVLQFGADGAGQTEFAWSAGKPGPSPETATQGPYRVWARILPLAARGEVKVSLAHPSGEVHTAYLPTGSPREWQWLDLGTFEADGTDTERLRLAGLGDVAWQLLELRIVPNGTEIPPPPPLSMSRGRSYREFGDRFDRSPGHGLGAWLSRSGTWGIEFSLDPNRIPMQYSLRAKLGAGDREGVLAADGPEWLGSRTSVSVFPEPGARCGIVLETPAGSERYLVSAGGAEDGMPGIAPHQWSRLTVEAWGWVRRFLVDGKEVAGHYDASPLAHRPALVLAAGEARFDDVRVDEIAWCAEDAAGFRLPWRLGAGADWRVRAKGRGPALRGLSGGLLPAANMAPARDVVLWHGKDAPGLSGEGFEAAPFAHGTVFRRHKGESSWSFVAPGDIDRVAVCASGTEEDAFHIGPYRFDAPKIPDPSDYLDFTADEWEAIRTSPEADKLARKPKQTQVVGRSSQYAIWAMDEGRWRVDDGVLRAWPRGRPARVRFWQHLEGAYSLRFRVRLEDGQSRARVILGEDNGNGIAVALYPQGGTGNADDDLALAVAPGEWTECAIDLGMAMVTARTRQELRNQAVAMVPQWSAPQSREIVRGIGGGLLLEADGRDVAFDDVEIAVPREGEGQWFYTFDRRETDWLRDGTGWIDHGGVSCALASNWVSLVTSDSRGMLWNKRTFAGDLLLSTNIEENSEWMGWEQDPSHIHHPYDNIVLCLGKGQDTGSGYRLEVNSRDRTATVLYRADKEVASVPQDYRFPIQYKGGHAPYSPRRNRISLVRQGNRLRALVNGVEVLSYTDPDPLATERVGIGGYQTHVNFSRIMVRELGGTR
jgi:hypothetical protein